MACHIFEFKVLVEFAESKVWGSFKTPDYLTIHYAAFPNCNNCDHLLLLVEMMLSWTLAMFEHCSG